MRDIIFNKLCIEDDMYLERAHRLGPRNIGHRNRPRPIIAAFRDYYDTGLILEKAFRLKESNYAVSRDYPQEISSARMGRGYAAETDTNGGGRSGTSCSDGALCTKCRC